MYVVIFLYLSSSYVFYNLIRMLVYLFRTSLVLYFNFTKFSFLFIFSIALRNFSRELSLATILLNMFYHMYLIGVHCWHLVMEVGFPIFNKCIFFDLISPNSFSHLRIFSVRTNIFQFPHAGGEGGCIVLEKNLW